MIRYACNWFIHSNPIRQKELERCVRTNVESGIFGRIFILLSNEQQPWMERPDVTLVKLGRYPMFSDFIKILNYQTGPHDINVMSNTDIIVNDTIKKAEEKLDEKTFYCIERWNETDTGELKFNGNPYGGSQDTWAWKGLLRVDSNQYNFKPGTWACDNVMAGMTERFGYQLSNPAYDIITRHVHLQESKSSIYMQVPPGPQKNVPVSPLHSLTN